MSAQETYEFAVTINFRVAADNEHDAMRAALDAEASLNAASLRASYGGSATVMRSKPPTMRSFKATHHPMPNEPAERTNVAEHKRRSDLLSPLTHRWYVRLRYRDGRTYGYGVEAPTREQAIEKARVKCYHETSHLGPSLSLLSVKQQED
jgi:hypothetical protein